jgi:hypothetical protein
VWRFRHCSTEPCRCPSADYVTVRFVVVVLFGRPNGRVRRGRKWLGGVGRGFFLVVCAQHRSGHATLPCTFLPCSLWFVVAALFWFAAAVLSARDIPPAFPVSTCWPVPHLFAVLVGYPDGLVWIARTVRFRLDGP